jgi:hypothetical protein
MRAAPAVALLAVLNTLALLLALALGRPAPADPVVVLTLASLVTLCTIATVASAVPAIAGRKLPAGWALGVYHVPACHFRLQLLSGGTVYCVLQGTNSSNALHDGDTIRLPGRHRSREPLLARRVEVLAGPDGPPVRIVEGRLPLASQVALVIERLSLATCAALILTLLYQIQQVGS